MDLLPALFLFLLGLGLGVLAHAAWEALSWLSIPAAAVSLLAAGIAFVNNDFVFGYSRTAHYTTNELLAGFGIVVAAATLGVAVTANSSALRGIFAVSSESDSDSTRF